MRFLAGIILIALFVGCPKARAAEARIMKVLPHYLDAKGRHTLSPSLYERDAYQAHLRENAELVSALRFDVQWAARGNKGQELTLQLEVRGGKAGSELLTIQEKVKGRRLFSTWSKVSLTKEQFAAIGGVNAWRASLWDGDRLVNEMKSFLWSRKSLDLRAKD